VSDTNAFISYFLIQPTFELINRIDWIKGLSFPNQGIAVTDCNYDGSKGYLVVTSSYSSDISTQPISLSVSYASMGNLTSNISTATITQSIVA
jgi:hypothetical protein